MRIISGIHKGKEILTPRAITTRPTTAVLREALFNIIQFDIENALFLDLFAGSGSIGLEALSRGASQVVFVENGRESSAVIKKNLERFEEKRGNLWSCDAKVALQKFHKMRQVFDFIYVDPPYGKEGHCQTLEILHLIDAYKLVKEGGTLFIEEDCKVSFEEALLKHLKFKNVRIFGRSHLFQFV